MDNDFRKIKKTQDDVKENDDSNNGKIYKISTSINCLGEPKLLPAEPL
jgi:hypothetical protein